MLTARSVCTPQEQPGLGEYGESLGRVTSLSLEEFKENVIEIVKSIPYTDEKSVYSIGDYGTADGAASMSFIRDLIVTLKELHGPDVEFQVIYEDQETNDFNSLFKRLSGVIQHPPSYLLELDNVYPLASGIQFRKQCVPSNSMHFIMSNIAVHWLSKNPTMYKDSVYIYPYSSNEEKQILYRQAHTDWELFLLMRSRELKEGGILSVISPLTRDDAGVFSLKTIIYILNNVWVSFRNAGRITKDEFINTNFQCCFYSQKQLRAPFDDDNSPVTKSGLHLVLTEERIVTCSVYSAWKKKKDLTGIDDRKEFAKNYVKSHKNWTYRTFLYGLADSRTKQEKDDIIEELYKMIEKKIAELHPDRFSKDLLNIHLLIRKE